MNSVAANTMAARSHRASYKTTSRRSEVDESLFKGTKSAGPNATVISKGAFAKHQSLLGSLNGANTSTLSTVELDRMKKTASGAFEREQQERQAQEMAEKREAYMKAQERKEKMKLLEAERKSRLAPTDLELKKAQMKEAVVSDAEKKMSEELDDVKKINQMCLYAKVVTIRDAQIHEKKVMEKERQAEERRLDTVMEIERLKALKMYEEREARRKLDQRQGAQVIIDQMQAREKERVMLMEMQDQEREAMIRQNEEMRAEERRVAESKVEAGKLLLEEVARSNSTQIALKREAAEQEKWEERKIQAYIREKEKREQALLHEQERIKGERERETAKLRAMQEKMKDKQAELDSLRAKRAVEETERAWRKKEREQAERQMQINSTLMDARTNQKLEKERRLIEQAQQEKEEFTRILRVQRDIEQAERTEKERVQEALKLHQQELQTQIIMNGEVRKKNRLDFLNEGVSMRTHMEEERIKLENIKEDKLGGLIKAGVPPKYTYDLVNKKFS